MIMEVVRPVRRTTPVGVAVLSLSAPQVVRTL